MSNPILLDIPEQFESNRLLIRAPRSGDGPALNEAVVESFNELRQWLPWAKTIPTIEESEEYCRAAYAKYLSKEDLALLLFCKTTGQLIGCSGLHRIDWDIPKFENGYWCRTSQTNKGYITEASHRVSLFALETLGANRVEIRIDTKNQASIRVPSKLGYTLEGTLHNDSRDNNDELSSTNIYAITSLKELKPL